MTILGIDLEKSNQRGETVLVVVPTGGGPAGPIEIADVEGLVDALEGKADAAMAAAALAALDEEVGTKATQSSVTALSQGLATTNGNLDGVSSVANAASSAAASAQATADAAKTTADAAVTPTALSSALILKADVSAIVVKGILNFGEVPPANGVYLMRPAP